VPGSCVGIDLALLTQPSVAVRSPTAPRRQALMFGSGTPKRFARNCSTEVWSNVSLQTNPPREKGEHVGIELVERRPAGDRGHVGMVEAAHAEQRAEVMVERAVLLHQDHDVLDVLQAGALGRGDRERVVERVGQRSGAEAGAGGQARAQAMVASR
jgi:hypothetical protein